MACWKARVEFLLSLMNFFFYLSRLRRYKAKCVKIENSLPSGGGRSLGAKISWGRGRAWGIFFGFYKTRHILLSDSANCIVLRAVVLTQYRRVTDGRTDGIAVASTALAMRRAVKTGQLSSRTGLRRDAKWRGQKSGRPYKNEMDGNPTLYQYAVHTIASGTSGNDVD